jgi:phage gpG-like protein
MFTIELKKIKDPISKLHPLIQKAIIEGLKAGMQVAEGKSKAEYLTGPRPAKLGVITGMLRSKVQSKVVRGTGNNFAIGILGVYDVIYSWIHELGGTTKPHTITAKNTAFLKIKVGKYFEGNNVRDKFIFAKSVHHPGSYIPARPYLRPALENSLPVINNYIDLAIMRAYNSLGVSNG